MVRSTKRARAPARSTGSFSRAPMPSRRLSTVRTFVQVLGAEPAADLLRTTVVASIGPVTAEAATQCHIQTTLMPSEYTIPALVEAIADYFEKQKQEAHV